MSLGQRINEEIGRILNGRNDPQQAAIGHLGTAAGRAAESLVYLADIDDARFGGEWLTDPYENDCVDDGHVRWAATGAVSSLDLCIAAAGRLGKFARSPEGKEDSIRTFYREDSETGVVKDNRSLVPSPWRKWIDGVVDDPRYSPLLLIRNRLVHADALRIISATTKTHAGHALRYEYRLRSLYNLTPGLSSPVAKARVIVEISRDLAQDHVGRFLTVLESMP